MPSLIISLIKKTVRMAGPKESREVMHNVAFLSGLQAITYILPVVILPYLFRTIGAEKFGLICFAQAFVQYFLILTDYGFNVTATKEISLCHNDTDKIRRVFYSVMSTKLLLMTVSLLVMGTLILTVPKFRQDWQVYALTIGVLVGNTIFPLWFFQGTEKMKYIAKLNIIGEFAYVFGIFYFVRGPQDYLMVPLVTSVVCTATGIMAHYILLTRFGIWLKLQSFSHIRHQLKVGWKLFVSVVAINTYTTTRIFAVGLLTNNTLTGYYSIAEKIANVAQTFPLSSFSQALFPRLSKIFHKSKLKAYQMMNQIQTITILISLICLPMIFLSAGWIVQLVCGGDYPQVAVALRLLILSVFFVSANAFRVQFLLVCGKTGTYSRIHFYTALVALPLILILINRYSYAGAALATVFIEGTIFSLTYFAVQRLGRTMARPVQSQRGNGLNPGPR